MEILSYPIGIVIGLFPVIVDLNGQPGPARLLLDGRQVCEVSVRAPACMIDVGPDPRVRALDLERLDRNGKVVERIRRWINRPTAEGKIRAVGSCDDKRGQCEFQLQWAHPAKLDPSSITLSLDGKTVRKGTDPLVRLSFPPKRPPQVLMVEAEFPDGQRAEFAQLLHGSYPERAEASLRFVPIEIERGQPAGDLDARLRQAGWKLRAIDEGEAEILFVLQPKAISRYAPSTSEVSRNPLAFGGALEGLGPLWFLPADQSLALLQPEAVGRHATHWLPAMMTMSSRASVSRIRIADAVAAAGYRLGGTPRRRVIVLVLGPQDAFQPDASTLSPSQALDYLREVGVPLVVWHIAVKGTSSQFPAFMAPPERPEWPEGEWIHTAYDFPRAVAHLRELVDRQRLAWLEEGTDTNSLGSRLPPGVSIAGRPKSFAVAAEAPPAGPHPDNADRSRVVFATCADPSQAGAFYAASADGLLHSSDSGATWTRVETGNAGGVFSLAFAGEKRERLLAGGSASLFRSVAAPPGWSGLSLPAVFALGVDPSNPSVVYAGTRGRTLRSVDGGLSWSDASGGIAATFALALAVSPRDPATVYAGTAGSGVFQSSDAGKTWHPSGPELQGTAVRAFAFDPDNSDIMYAGTDGGVFVSADAGKSWKIAGLGSPRAVTYALAIDPANKARLFAATSSGLYVADYGGRAWKRSTVPKAPVTSLAFDAAGKTLMAGTLGEGAVALDLAALETEPVEGFAPVPPGRLQAVQTKSVVPAELLPPTATGPELPLKLVLTNRRAHINGQRVDGRLSVTIGIGPILEAVAKNGRAHILLSVVSESPTETRSNLARLERSLPFDATVDHWTLEVPVTWWSRDSRLIAVVVESGTGAHAAAAIDLRPE